MSTTLPSERPSPVPGTPEGGHYGRKAGLLGVVEPNSQMHWSLLIAGVAGRWPLTPPI